MIQISSQAEMTTFRDSITTRTFQMGLPHMEIVPPVGEETLWSLSLDFGQSDMFPMRKFSLTGTEEEVEAAQQALIIFFSARNASDPALMVDYWDVETVFEGYTGFSFVRCTYPKAA